MVPKQTLAGLGPATQSVDGIEQPGELGAREVRVEKQPGPGADHLFQTLLPEPVAHRGGAPVLPDDGTVQRCAGAAVPDHHGLALVGHAEGGNPVRGDAGALECRPRGLHHGMPYFLRVVFHLPFGGKVLGEFLLAKAANPPFAIEDEGAGGRGSLVDGQDMTVHGPGPPKVTYRSRTVQQVTAALHPPGNVEARRTRPPSGQAPSTVAG